MKKPYLFVLSALVLFVYACGGKQGNKTQQNLIVGKWTMQKQNVVVYRNDAEQSESNVSTSDKTVAYLQFNNNGSYTAVSLFNSGGIGSLDAQVTAGADTTRGNYNFTSGQLTMSQPLLASLWSGSVTGAFGSGATTIPTVKLVSQEVSIVQLTSSLFTLRTVIVTTQTNGNSTDTYKTSAEYYYTR